MHVNLVSGPFSAIFNIPRFTQRGRCAVAQWVEGGTLNRENPDSNRELLCGNLGRFVHSATFQFQRVSAHSWVLCMKSIRILRQKQNKTLPNKFGFALFS